VTRDTVQKLQRIYKYSKQLLEVAKLVHDLDPELYMSIIEYHNLVCVLIDNIEIYEDAELNEIIAELDITLRSLVRRMQQEV